MRKQLLFLIVSIFFINTYAQIDFTEHLVIDDSQSTYNPEDINSVDIDGDGDMDIVSAIRSPYSLVWYENLNGQGDFGPQRVIFVAEPPFGWVRKVIPVDLDQDGDMDLISTDTSNSIVWVENLDGNGTFGERILISDQIGSITSIVAEDIDNDGDKDILASGEQQNEVVWLKNNLPSTFWPMETIEDDALEASSVYAADIDGDGDNDVLSTSYGDDKIAWYENTDGLGNFGQQQIIAIANRAQSVHANDLDNDGDMDTIAVYDNNTLVWYENLDGLGNFGPGNLIIENTTDWYIKCISSDIDNDGDIDILLVGSSQLITLENMDGQGGYDVGQIIDFGFSSDPLIGSLGDINGDNLLDILAGSSTYDLLGYFKNNEGVGDFSSLKAITNHIDRPESVQVVDIDGDGDKDLLTVSVYSDFVTWFENLDGQGTFSSQNIIGTGLFQTHTAFASDFDGDGDMDVVTTGRRPVGVSRLVWFENLDGQGNFSPENLIDDRAGSPRSIVADDLDGDGDMDIISAHNGNVSSASWYENIDGAGNFGPIQIINETDDFCRSVFTADIDGDGDKDVIAGHYRYLIWNENMDGLGNFGPDNIILFNAGEFIISVYATDLDGDSDIDIVSASLDQGIVAWYENMDGQGTFGLQQTILSTQGPRSVYAGDIDEDGDKDIVYSSTGTNRIGYFENLNGQGNFGTEQIISTSQIAPGYISMGDIDRDGVIDVIATSGEDNKIIWYENSTPNLSINDNNLPIEFSISPNPASTSITIHSKHFVTEVKIFNQLGQLVLEENDSEGIETIRIDDLNQGLYFVKLKDVSSSFGIQKLLKN